MRKSALGLIVAAVLAGGAFGLLTGCSRAPADESADSPVPAPSTVPPAAPTARPIPPSTATERAPLGLEVRYVDADGRFRTVAPKDFHR